MKVVRVSWWVLFYNQLVVVFTRWNKVSDSVNISRHFIWKCLVCTLQVISADWASEGSWEWSSWRCRWQQSSVDWNNTAVHPSRVGAVCQGSFVLWSSQQQLAASASENKDLSAWVSYPPWNDNVAYWPEHGRDMRCCEWHTSKLSAANQLCMSLWSCHTYRMLNCLCFFTKLFHIFKETVST